MGLAQWGRRSSDRGGAVVIVLLLGGLMSAVGAGLLLLSSTERAVAGNFQAGVRTLYAAEALAERVVLDLVTNYDWTAAVSGARQSAFVDPNTRPVAPWGETLDAAAMTTALQLETDVVSSRGADTPRWRLFASGTLAALGGAGYEAPVYLLAWVADDPAERDGDPSVDTNGVALIRAQALAVGGTRRSVQLVVHKSTPLTSDAGTDSRPEEAPPPIEPPDLARIVPSDNSGELSEPLEVRVLSWREVR